MYHTVEYQLVVKNIYVQLIHAVKWMNLKTIVQSETSQSVQYGMTTFI